MTLPKVNDFKLISVDIFDTLILRAVAKPTDLFEHIWRRATRDGVAKAEMSGKEFVKFRVEMERRARLKKADQNREVTLRDIYVMFPDYVAYDVDKLRQLELECEKEYCYKNPIIYDWLAEAKRNGCVIVLVSDMYLERDEVLSIFDANGIDAKMFNDIIISNEYKRNKQNGELFDVLIEKYQGIKREDIIHIGDNENADYAQALKKGIRAFHYDAVPEHLYSIFDYEKIRHNVPLEEILSLRKACMYNADYEGEEKTAYEIGSAVVGPALVFYTSWACARMKKLGIGRVYPFMREGWLLGRLLKNEAADLDMELQVKPIYISRKVTYIPSIEKIDREEIENMLGARNLTIRESIRLMGLDDSDFADMDGFLDKRYKESHLIKYKGTSLKESVIARFLEKENVKKEERFIREQRRLLIGYLEQEIGCMDGVATIDIGFFGRIQMWMQKCLDLEGVPHKIKHFLAIGVTGDKVYDGYDFEGMFGTFAQNQDLIQTVHRTTDVLEKLISVADGSTVGYEDRDGKIVPKLSEKLENEKLTDIVFEGIFDFQKIWHRFRKMKPQIAACALDKKREMLKILHRLIDMPRKSEAEMIGGLEADTNFGTEYRKRIITAEHIKLARERGVDFIDRCNISYTYEGSCVTWPKGVATLVDEFYYVRRALKNGSDNEIIKSMQDTVEMAARDGVKEVALYGAGENGRQFYFLCRMYGIKVSCFVDRKESLWGTFKEGIKIVGLDEAMSRGNDVYVIASLFSISEINDFILGRYKKSGRLPKIYSV